MTGEFLSIRLAVTAFSLITGVVAPSSRDTEQLLDRLFANYSVLVRPAKDQKQPIQINVLFTIKQLESVDIKSQTMRSLGHFSINWTDEFLTWAPDDYGGIKYITVPENKIWRPDYVLNNEFYGRHAEAFTKYGTSLVNMMGNSIRFYDLYMELTYLHTDCDRIHGRKRMGDGTSLVVIDSDGQILWEPSHLASTLCYMDITYFPFDKQMCSVHVTPWMTSDVSLHTTSNQGVSLNDLKLNGEFEVTGARVDHTVYPMTYKRDEMLEGVSFVIMLKRRTTFYWLSLVSPLIAFPFLSPLSFLVPADSGEKTTLAMTALLSVFVFMNMVYDIMPRLSNTVSYFVVLSSTQVFISLITVVCNIIILCVERLSTDHIVPTCLKKLVIRYSRQKRSGKMVNVNNNALDHTDVTDEESEAGHMEKVKWVEVARYLDRICFIVSFGAVLLVTLIFGILMFT